MNRARCNRARSAVIATILAVSFAGTLSWASLASAAPGRDQRPTASHIQRNDWPAFLDGPSHHSYNGAETKLTWANARRIELRWRFTPRPQRGPSGFVSSPVVADGAVFIGGSNGWFYKLSERTGHVLRRVFIGFQPALTCPPGGFADTAAVAPDPRTHKDMVYVGGPNGVLYAFRASNLSTKWRSDIARPSHSVNNYFQWSSPTVAAGRIYIGVASACDNPLVRGQVIEYSQATGRVLARFFTELRGVTGGTVWSSPAVHGGFVYVSTGNPQGTAIPTGFSDAIIKLRVRNLRYAGMFQVSAAQAVNDGDFGSSPTLFWPYVGACNKNGVYYTLNMVSMRLKWERQIGAPALNAAQCSAAAVYDGRFLYIAGPATTIHGRFRHGSIRKIGPKTGRTIWATGLPNSVVGTPTMDGGGLIAVGTYDFTGKPNAIYLIGARTGRIIRVLQRGGFIFAQSVFADGMIFTANQSRIEAWGLPAKPKKRH